ncbi:hypothetical protein ACWCOV_03105 [Kribbella sp. NPDC002412]
MIREEYFAFPIVAGLLIGGVVLLLRWAFSSAKGGSLVRRTDYKPADRSEFGLLVGIHTARTFADARQVADRLTGQQIRATIARTTDGWAVYVWPDDEAAAREFLKAS